MQESALLEEFVRYLGFERGLSKNTRAAYSGDARVFLEHCARLRAEPAAAAPDFLDAYLWELKQRGGLAARTMFRKMESLRAFYRFLAIEGKIARDPTRHFKAPHMPERIPRYLSEAEVARLLDYPADTFPLLRTKTIIELFYASGIRISELLNIRLEALNLEQNWVMVYGKGGKERIVPVNLPACKALSRYLDERRKLFGSGAADELFVNRSGGKLSRVQVWSDIKKLGQAAGLGQKLHPHMLRHTFASHLLKGGADLRSLQELLGHANLSTTQIYTHIDKSDLSRTHRKFHPRNY